ncbi:hypothetical protein BC628DRAFT_66423 [Trametes gibbosa]|nr:hypothetical protein BC628DRAFT_66423 [Trametes gibbosa]
MLKEHHSYPPTYSDWLSSLKTNGSTDWNTRKLGHFRRTSLILDLSPLTLKWMNDAGRQRFCPLPSCLRRTPTRLLTWARLPSLRLVKSHLLPVDPTEFLYRSYFLHIFFSLPTGRIQHMPTTTAGSVFKTPLVRDMLKACRIRYTAIHDALALHAWLGRPIHSSVIIWVGSTWRQVHPLAAHLRFGPEENGSTVFMSPQSANFVLNS